MKGVMTAIVFNCNSAAPRAAIIACTKIIGDKREDSDGRVMALQNRGYYYQAIGGLDHSIADYTTVLQFSTGRSTKAIALNPTNALAWRDRGFAYRNKGGSAKAIADATVAIRSDPDVARAHLDLGLSLQATGDAKQALVEFGKAIELDPSDTQAFKAIHKSRRIGVPVDRAVRPTLGVRRATRLSSLRRSLARIVRRVHIGERKRPH
jgi:tetratricopeptide (TPR) repeat protein